MGRRPDRRAGPAGRRHPAVCVGPAAAEVAALFAPTDLEAVVPAGDVAAASALKMCYAAWTKGTSALLLAIRAAAGAHGVEAALLAVGAHPAGPGRAFAGRRRHRPQGVAVRWRDGPDRAVCFAEAGLPDGFAAAAELYRRLASFKDLEGDPPLAEVLGRARGQGETPGS